MKENAKPVGPDRMETCRRSSEVYLESETCMITGKKRRKFPRVRLCLWGIRCIQGCRKRRAVLHEDTESSRDVCDEEYNVNRFKLWNILARNKNLQSAPVATWNDIFLELMLRSIHRICKKSTRSSKYCYNAPTC